MDPSITLTPLLYADLPFLQEVRNHPETRSFLHDQRVFTLEQVQDWFTRERPPWRSIIVDGVLVGYLRLEIDDRNKQVKVGCDIHPAHRRKGYASESLRIVLREFGDRGFHRAWLEVLPYNYSALRMYENLGFVRYGLAHGAVLNTNADGKEVWSDSILMERMLRCSTKTKTGSPVE